MPFAALVKRCSMKALVNFFPVVFFSFLVDSNSFVLYPTPKQNWGPQGGRQGSSRTYSDEVSSYFSSMVTRKGNSGSLFASVLQNILSYKAQALALRNCGVSQDIRQRREHRKSAYLAMKNRFEHFSRIISFFLHFAFVFVLYTA